VKTHQFEYQFTRSPAPASVGPVNILSTQFYNQAAAVNPDVEDVRLKARIL
jgi:hypothetical protein